MKKTKPFKKTVKFILPLQEHQIISIWNLSWKNRIRAILGLRLEDINYWGRQHGLSAGESLRVEVISGGGGAGIGTKGKETMTKFKKTVWAVVVKKNGELMGSNQIGVGYPVFATREGARLFQKHLLMDCKVVKMELREV